MSNLREIISPLLALIVVGGGYAIIYTKPEVKTEIIGLMTLVLSFYFGSSKGSDDKNKFLMGEKKDE